MDKNALKMIIESAKRKGMIKELASEALKNLKSGGLLSVLDIVFGEMTPEQRREFAKDFATTAIAKSVVEMAKSKEAA